MTQASTDETSRCEKLIHFLFLSLDINPLFFR